MMQLTYLTFTAPRRDDDAFASYKNRNKAALQNMEMNPQVAFSDSVSAGIYMHHPRRARIKADMIDKMDYDKILSMYQDRYKDASDFTFIFVGNECGGNETTHRRVPGFTACHQPQGNIQGQ